MSKELEFLEEKHGDNSWGYYPPSKREVAQWLQEWTKKQFAISGVSKSLNADELINSLGAPDIDNEYIIKPDKHGKWQIEHKHVGSGEPLKQWLTGKP